MRTFRSLALSVALGAIGFVLVQSAHPAPVFAQAKESVFVNLTSDEPQRVTMALNFATKLVEGGNTVTLFLNVDGVRLASTKVATLSQQRRGLAAFMKAGGTVVICPHCMQVRKVAESDLMAGLTMGGEGAATQAFLSSPRSISY
ncbi:MAG: DsrE family protein [Vicinamibacterales bacterium]